MIYEFRYYIDVLASGKDEREAQEKAFFDFVKRAKIEKFMVYSLGHRED